jgi:hypothetical protein
LALTESSKSGEAKQSRAMDVDKVMLDRAECVRDALTTRCGVLDNSVCICKYDYCKANSCCE